MHRNLATENNARVLKRCSQLAAYSLKANLFLNGVRATHAANPAGTGSEEGLGERERTRHERN